jgi:ArsR family transcriptional regulator
MIIDGNLRLVAGAARLPFFPPNAEMTSRRPSMARAATQNATPTEDDALVGLLRACADPARLAILRLLARDAFGVQELGSILGLGQATVSHHLKALVDAGLLTARRDGTHTFYRRALASDGELARLAAVLLEEIDARPLTPEHRARRDAIYRERAERSRAFFQRNADRFDANRELIAAPDAYLPDLAELLPPRGTRALEVGPGPGEFLPTLAERFDTVHAVDISSEMVERARRRCETAGVDNVRLHAGELPEAGRPSADAALADALDEPVDVVVCAMVLHHVAAPEELVARCAARLAPGGQLLVADLCPHGQDWVFDACGDVWPGIDPDALTEWASAAGLEPGPSQFLARRNGFRIQLRRFDAPAAA